MTLWEIGLLAIVKRFNLNVYELSDASLVAISSGILLGVFILIAAITASVQNKLPIKRMGNLSFVIIILIFFITGYTALSDRDILLRFSSQSIFQFSNLIYSLFAGIFIVLFSGILGSLYGLIMGIVSFLISMLLGETVKDSHITYPSKIKLIETVNIKNIFTSQIKVVSAPKLKRKKQIAKTGQEKLLIFFSYGLFGWAIGYILGLGSLNEKLIIVLWLCIGVYIAEIDFRIKELIIKSFCEKTRKNAIKWQNFMYLIVFVIASGITAYTIPDTIFPKFIVVFIFVTVPVIPCLIKWENEEETINIILISPFKKTISINILKTLSPEKMEINQGIWRSGLNAIKFSSVTGLLVGTLTAVQLHSAGLSSWLGSLLLGLLTFGLKGGFTAGLLLGGKAVIQHFVLRGVLCLTDDYPWDYARFLKYVEELMFMYKVGGRYQFIHDLLQKHFAAMKPQKYSS